MASPSNSIAVGAAGRRSGEPSAGIQVRAYLARIGFCLEMYGDEGFGSRLLSWYRRTGLEDKYRRLEAALRADPQGWLTRMEVPGVTPEEHTDFLRLLSNPNTIGQLSSEVADHLDHLPWANESVIRDITTTLEMCVLVEVEGPDIVTLPDLLHPLNLPPPTGSWQVSFRGRTRRDAYRRAIAEVEQILLGPRAPIPHRKAKAHVDWGSWLYRIDVKGESIASVARSVQDQRPDADPPRKKVRENIRRARALMQNPIVSIPAKPGG